MLSLLPPSIFMTKIILSGQPLSTQSIYKTHCKGRFPTLYMTREGKAKKEDYQWQAKSQHKKSGILTSPLSLEIDLYFKDKRKHDIDNFNKLILDSLEGIIFKDDSQIEELKIRKFYDKLDPRVEVIIKVLN